MKQKIKLRDMTEKQYETWRKENCLGANCNTCPFHRVECLLINSCWIKNKELYSDKFLNQQLEIELPELLTKKEKLYLEGVIRPFKDIVVYIAKSEMDNNLEYLCINIKDDYHLCFPNFLRNKYYKNLEIEKKYTLKELGLFQPKYKITLTEFWNSEDKLAIHCDTEEKANKFIKESNKTYRWGNFPTYYEVNEKETCYSNESLYCDYRYYNTNGYTIYEFDEVDLEN